MRASRRHDIIREYWQGQRPEKDKAFEVFWETSLHDGADGRHGIAGDCGFAALRIFAKLTPQATGGEGLEIVFKPDPTTFDGRFANNGWLQELPKPNTRLTWDNAAMISPATAQRLGLETGDYVTLQLGRARSESGRLDRSRPRG